MSTAASDGSAPRGRCAGLLLAAGAGRRMGHPKALVRLGGQLLVERAARSLAEGGCEPVLVVLGAGADEVRHAADLRAVEVVDNPAWAAGQSTSLRVGLVALGSDRQDRPPGAVLVSVVDQPGMTPAVVTRLLDAWRRSGATVVQATYDGRPRNPVLLDASVLEEVATFVDGDEGARRWLAERRSVGGDVVLVECGDVGAPDDVDTPDDLSGWTDGTRPDPTKQDVLAASGPADRSAR